MYGLGSFKTLYTSEEFIIWSYSRQYLYFSCDRVGALFKLTCQNCDFFKNLFFKYFYFIMLQIITYWK